jgi:serine/threonine-protein kinase HipA
MVGCFAYRRQIQRKDTKFAMSVGKNRQYHIHEIQPRRYLQIADRPGLAGGKTEWALEEVADTLPDAMNIACESLPADFPEEMRDTIVEAATHRCEIITAT